MVIFVMFQKTVKRLKTLNLVLNSISKKKPARKFPRKHLQAFWLILVMPT
jgi:hypothetical protein